MARSRRNVSGLLCAVAALALALPLLSVSEALADSLAGALARVYQNNPQLNAQRAALRVTDENVPQALSGYRPQISAAFTAGINPVTTVFPDGTSQSATLLPWTIGATITQPLFNGFKTGNAVRQAESQVRSGREALRSIEQTVFVAAVTAYMNVVSDQAQVESQKANVTFLRETLASTRKSLEAGQVTPTDVAQAEARLARGQSDLNTAEVVLATDQASYTQVIGVAPGHLQGAEPPDGLLPASRDEAIAIGRRENPAIVAATFDVDAAQSAVRVAESALLPTVSAVGAASRAVGTDPTFTSVSTTQASLAAQATVPIYDGGLAASQVRAAKETLGQLRLVLDQTRLQADASVTAAWVQHEGAKAAIRAAEAEVRASTTALDGVRREQQAGQRTTLDVLNAQQDLTAARGRLIGSQRDRVVAGYTLLAAIGRLDHKRLALATPEYEPQTHYYQVRDAWHGLRTPSGQ